MPRGPGRTTLVEQTYGAVQRKATEKTTEELGASPTAERSGSGQGLPDPVRGKMERAFSADFSGVSVRESSEASALGAQAFTRGSEVVFAPGHYHPDSERGQSLIGHELAHVVQQSEGRVAPTIQGKGIALNDDAGLEAEADDLGARAARGEVVRSGGPSMDGRAAPTQLKASGSVIQLAPLETHWGRFIDRTYSLMPHGCHMTLDFEPGPGVDATKIGLSQSVRGDAGTTPVSLDPTNERRMVPSGPGAGYGIDRVAPPNNPIYGARSLGSGQTLSDTATTNAPSGVTPSPGSSTTPRTASYELGHRHGTTTPKNAWLDDLPQDPSLSNTVFETTALALEGTQRGTYYGSVRWGWERGGSGVTLVPFTRVSEGMPSQNFLAAAEAWNASTAQGTIEAKNSPTQCFRLASGAFVADYDVPRGTQIDHLSTTTAAGVVYDFVRIVDGTHARATTYIRNLDLRDRGNGAATVDLPVPDVHVVDAGDLELNEFISGATRTPVPRGTRCVPNPADTRTVRTPAELVLIRVEIADGPLTGQSGYVRRTALRDERP
jgi:hypothetical protein